MCSVGKDCLHRAENTQVHSLKHKRTTLPVGSHRGESSKVTVLDFLDSHTSDLPSSSGFKCRSAVRSPGQHGVWEAKKEAQDREKCLKGEQQIWRESRRQALPTGALPVCAVSAIGEVGLLLPSQRTSQKAEVQIPTQWASFTCTYKWTPQGHRTHSVPMAEPACVEPVRKFTLPRVLIEGTVS